jgi:hypothetical protein
MAVDIFQRAPQTHNPGLLPPFHCILFTVNVPVSVILVGIDSEMNSSVPFMAAAHSLGYTSDPSFVFIIFSINNNYQSRPWDADYDGMSYPYLRQAYEGAYILRIEGMDDVSVNTFRQRLLDSQNYTNPRVSPLSSENKGACTSIGINTVSFQL